MSDPCYKDITCPYCGKINHNVETAWIEDERCYRCGKWIIHKEHNLLEDELKALEKEYEIRRKNIYKKYETKPVFKMERIK